MRMKFHLGVLVAAVTLLGAPAQAEETLADWAHTISQPETQRKILDRIFPDQLGSVSDAVFDKKNGTYFFPKNSAWVRLGKDFVWSPSTKTPYLVVTCMLYHDRNMEPTVANSYLVRDITQRPITLTAGYATHERLHLVELPKLGRSFLVVEDSVASPQGAMRQWTAFLLEVESKGLSDHPRNVWTSPLTVHSFQLGFDDLGGKDEKLVLRTVTPPVPKNTDYSDVEGMDEAYTGSARGGPTSDSQYMAYAWTGDRFEADTTVFTSRLKDLPESVWRYGTGR